jgi:cytochrome c oxidase cbb3-type subunit I/II
MASANAMDETTRRGLASNVGNPSAPAGSFSYDDAIVRWFVGATLFWGLMAMLGGVVVGCLLVMPKLFQGVSPAFAPWLTFGRLRPIHTNAAIYAFIGNAIFAAIYYSTQRLCKARMWSGWLSRLHFWSWQAIIVAACVTLPLGITQGKEFAELEWPIDIAIAVVWILFFGVNFFATLAVRRDRHLYISLWFYIASIIAVGVLHLVNNFVVPIGWDKSYPMFGGVQEAMLQWWYGHNLLAFLLTMPFLGLMYYFLPKAANRPIYSYRLAIIHFWALVLLYVWAGPQHLHFTTIPEWASSLGMIFGLMLWMPAWGGLINGLMTLRSAGAKMALDPVLKFFFVALVFYGIATLEGSLMSVKSVNALTQYSDWTIAHMHVGALGWNGMLIFAMTYWLLPKLYQTKLWSPMLVTWHLRIAVLGILLYIIPIHIAGIIQTWMWRAQNDLGRLQYVGFLESIQASFPYWWARLVGGGLYVLGMFMLGFNVLMTRATRPAKYEVQLFKARREDEVLSETPPPPASLEGKPVLDFAVTMERFASLVWHRRWERQPAKVTWAILLIVVVASLAELIPTFIIRSNVPLIATVKPYTPLELAGRDLYIAEGCFNCHSQMIRPLVAEVQRYGEFSKPGESVYDHPVQWGSRRIGPDLAREGGKQSSYWHWQHFEKPDKLSPGSIMPAYQDLLDQELNHREIGRRMAAIKDLGAVAETDGAKAEDSSKKQAEKIAAEIIAQGGPVEYGDHLVKDTVAVALIAYIQRVGTDRFKTEAPAPAAVSPLTAQAAVLVK